MRNILILLAFACTQVFAQVPGFNRPAVTASGGGLTVGGAVTGGGANRVLYEDGSQNLATAASFTFNGTALTAVLTGGTGLPISTGLTGAGTGVLTALGVNIGSAGAPVLFNGAGGTPSSLTLTSATGLPISTGLTGGATNAIPYFTSASVMAVDGTNFTWAGAAGVGLVANAGTATLNTQSPLRTTQALNAVGVSFPGVVHAFTGGATAAAGTNLFDVTLDAVHMMTLTKAGALFSNTLMVGGATNPASRIGRFVGASGLSIVNSTADDTGIILRVIGGIPTVAASFDSTGAYQPLYLSTNGSEKLSISTGSVVSVGTGVYGAGATVGGAADVGISRTAAATLALGNGTAGNASGTLQLANIVNSGSVMVGSATTLTLTAGAVGMAKMTASASAPGAAGTKIEAVCGTNAGTAKLVMYAGTSGTAVTVVDNVGTGVTGC